MINAAPDARTRLVSARCARVEPFRIMDVWVAADARQRTHGDLLSLFAGQPATPAPAPVRRAAAAALREEPLGYTVASGSTRLREAIAAHYVRGQAIAVSGADVVITTGSSGGFLLAFLACFDSGDRVALARPGYPPYRSVLRALGCEVVELACGAGTRFQPTVELLAKAHADGPLRGVVITSPANPTGSIIEPSELGRIAQWCDAHGVQLVSDEIYHGIRYPGAPRTSCAWEHSREAIVVSSFSKYYSMTGWRLGWMLVPPRLTETVDRLAGHLTVCPPVLSQHAALAAFDPESVAEVEGHVLRYASNRTLLLDGLSLLGIDTWAPADGAFYVYADVRHLTSDSVAWCELLLAEAGVGVAPGIDFDRVEGRGHVRFSYSGTAESIAEALERMRQFVERHANH